MGWCSATSIFDSVCEGLLSDQPKSKKEVLKELIVALEDGDWDCQTESEFYDNPLVQEVMRELHPHWFDDDA
jgi:hypothetical protein